MLSEIGSKDLRTQKSIIDRSVGTIKCEATSISIGQGLFSFSTDVKNTPRIVKPHSEELKHRILNEAHDTAVSYHFGRDKTYDSVIQIDGCTNSTNRLAHTGLCVKRV